MKQILIIDGDYNDGDIITERTTLKNNKYGKKIHAMLARVVPIVKGYYDVIMAQRASEEAKGELLAERRKYYSGLHHNWPTSEYCKLSPQEIYKHILSSDDIEMFGELVPRGKCGIHTIETIYLITISKEVRLL